MGKAIPLEWIRGYVDTFLALAARFNEDPGGFKMRDATILRIDHIADMVKAWKETGEPETFAIRAEDVARFEG